MSVSRAYLERCADDTGFQVPALEKVVRLGELAGEIGRDPLLGESLALKGGTALNLAFGPPGRLSVDLDYNYVAQVDRAKMLAERSEVEQAVESMARRSGYAIQRSADAFAGRKLHLRYRSEVGHEETIQVDVNYLFRLPLAEVQTRELWQPGELDRPEVRMVATEELLVGKLLALLDRCAARDAWDVANLPAEPSARLASRAFRPLFIALAGVLDHALPTYGRARLESRLAQDVVDATLAPMLARGTRRSARELVLAAWARIQELVELSPAENEYMDGIHRGRLDLSVLFPEDPELAAKLATHPALLWKAQNARGRRMRRDASAEAHDGDAP